MNLELDTSSPMPIYAQLIEQIRRAISAGQLKSGEQLPTVRQLAVELRINANTVARVYGELEHMRIIATQRGRGTFVAARSQEVSESEREMELIRLAHTAIAEAEALGYAPAELASAIEKVISQEGN